MNATTRSRFAFFAGRPICRGVRRVALCAALAAAVALGPLASGSPAATFAFQVESAWEGSPAVCAGSYPRTVLCFLHPGGPVAVSGLGVVSQSYVYPVETEPGPACKGGFNVLPYTARLAVKGKGEIFLTLGAVEDCLFGQPSDTVLSPTQSFTITGGSGVYAGASGSGVVKRTQIHRTRSGHGAGTDIWEGRLVAPSLEFDTAPPDIEGAVAKVVRAPRKAAGVPVRYQLAARDVVDGAVPVSCQPASGSRFAVGRRTVVRCSATDTSANTARVSFSVTVRPQR